MLTDTNYFDAPQVFPEPPDRLVDQAMRNVAAGRSAHALLRDIDAGTGRPDELADRLLALLVDVDDAHRADVVKGFLRPIEKRLEAHAAKVQGAA